MRTILIVLLAVFVSVLAVKILDKNEISGQAAASNEVYDRVVKSGTIRCGYSPWPPFVDKDPNTGKMSGILVDILDEIGKELNLKIDWAYETGYGNYTEDLNTGRFDVMCATLWADSGRIRNSLLIDPFLYTGVYIITRADDTRFDLSFAGLNDPGMTVAGVDGDITLTMANNIFPQSQKLSLPAISSPAQLMDNVATRKADASFADLGFFNSYIRENPGKLKALTQNPAWVFGERMAVKNGEYRLKYMLDTAISEIVNAGKTAEIIKRYPGTSTVAPLRTYEALSQ